MKRILFLFVVVLFIGSQASAGLEDDLVLYLTFDNVKNKRILDASGNDLDARVVQNVNFVEGKHGDAIKIRANTEDCVNVPASETLKISEITMSAWIYRENWANGSGYWLDKGSYAGPANMHAYGMAVFQVKDVHWNIGDLINAAKTILVMSLGSNGNHSRLSVSIPSLGKRTWHHVVGTYDGAFRTIYLNGEVFFDTEKVGFEPTKVFADTNDEDLRIGCAKGKKQYAFDHGLIDEVAIWSRALTESEVRTAMKGNFLAVSPRDKVSTTWGDIKRRTVGK
ncbi:LamG domain-containing protein [Candidatus Poribacteria bacterium]|nr:LamG domain-containing protein [Candidatus Poribacteria bacterium]MYK19539.1 LamG domain-containing protein [Candidatus Poribacteria bacterium]